MVHDAARGRELNLFSEVAGRACDRASSTKRVVLDAGEGTSASQHGSRTSGVTRSEEANRIEIGP